jgi:hypothetical protein
LILFVLVTYAQSLRGLLVLGIDLRLLAQFCELIIPCHRCNPGARKIVAAITMHNILLMVIEVFIMMMSEADAPQFG